MAAILLLAFLLALLVTLALYALIDDETSNPRVVDRETAEREARAFGGFDGRDRSGRDGTGKRAPRDRRNDRTAGPERDRDDTWGYSRLDEERER